MMRDRDELREDQRHNNNNLQAVLYEDNDYQLQDDRNEQTIHEEFEQLLLEHT